METEDNASNGKSNFAQANQNRGYLLFDRGSEMPNTSYNQIESDPRDENFESQRSPKNAPKSLDDMLTNLFNLPELIRIDNVQKESSHKIASHNLEIFFPFQPYDAQTVYMSKVIETLNGKQNALLQSPAGTGKILSLMCATMAWINNNRTHFLRNPSEMINYRPNKIYFVSRSESRIKQLVRDLKLTCYRPKLVILGSKEQHCVKSDFNGLQKAQLEAACTAVRLSNIAELRCGFYDSYEERKNAYKSQQQKVLADIEDLAQAGKRDKFCPYYLERDLEEEADIVALSPNYLLDRRVRDTHKLALKDSIVIFDEGHCIESLAEEGSSFRISIKDVEGCEQDLKALKQRARRSEINGLSEAEVELMEGPILNLRRKMENMKRNILTSLKSKSRPENAEKNDKTMVKEGRKVFPFIKEITAQRTNDSDSGENVFKEGIDHQNFSLYLDLLKKGVEEVCKVVINRGALANLLHSFSLIYELMKTDLEAKSRNQNIPWIKNPINSYMFHTDCEDDEAGSEFSFSLSCLHPGLGFDFVQRQGCRSIIVTSENLQPLRSLEAELAAKFLTKFVNSHSIHMKQQCQSFVLQTGPSGYPLNFSYDTRFDAQTFKEMGEALLKIAGLVPNGILVCFATDRLMKNCLDSWSKKDETLLTRIEALKRVHKEPKKENQVRGVIEDYIRDAKTKGSILCYVSRGRVSKMTNLGNEMTRAIVMVGVPYPHWTDKRVEYKKEFLTKNQLQTRRIDGKQWYAQQTMKALNQEIGKVIGNAKDYGMVFLCDKRYTDNKIKNEIVDWISENLDVPNDFGSVITRTTTFFQGRVPSNMLLPPLSVIPASPGNATLIFSASPSSNGDLGHENSLQLSDGMRESSILSRHREEVELQENIASGYQILLNNQSLNGKKVRKNEDSGLESKTISNPSTVLEQDIKKISISSDMSSDDNLRSQIRQKSPVRRERETSGGTGEIQCVVCIGDATSRNPKSSNCGHIACNLCWDNWLSITDKCPSCSARISKVALIQVGPVQHRSENNKDIQGSKNEKDVIDKTIHYKASISEREHPNKATDTPARNEEQKIVINDKNNAKKQQCVVCSGNILNGEISDCGHLACSECWKNWLEITEQCPICFKRISIITSIKTQPQGDGIQSRNPLEHSNETQTQNDRRKNQVQTAGTIISPNEALSFAMANCLCCERTINLRKTTQSTCNHGLCPQCKIFLAGTIFECPTYQKRLKIPALEQSQPQPESQNRFGPQNPIENRSISNLISQPNAGREANQVGGSSSVNPESQTKSGTDANKTETVIKNSLGVDCLICLENRNVDMMVSRCGHVACKTCWLRWLQNKAVCPACKATTKPHYLIKLHI